MRALRFDGALRYVTDAPVVRREGEALVQVLRAGICNTDLEIVKGYAGFRGTLGHEFVGRVVESPGGALAGRRVVGEINAGCGACALCRAGDPRHCAERTVLGIHSRDGAFAEYIAIPEKVAWKTGKEIDHRVASIQEPFGNAVHATFAGEIAQRTVAVFGCGPIGLWAVGLARVSGSSTIFAIEPNHKRLDIAVEMGADHIINPRDVDPVQKILEVTGGLGVDVVLEMSGHPTAIRQGFGALRNGGRVSLLGIPSSMVELDLADEVIFKGATVLGISGRRIFDTWYRTRRILEAGQLDLERVITHTLPFEQIHDAMEIMKSGDCGKIVLTF